MLRHSFETPLHCSYRAFSSSQRVYAPLQLAYDLHAAPVSGASEKKSPLVILHGLFGSKQNWRSLARALAQRTERDVYTLVCRELSQGAIIDDSRNHGDSPHSSETTYTDYASDVSRFLKDKQLEKVVLMGHSMGGKIAMAHALAEPDSLEKLISVDMSPAKGAISPEFAMYITAMRKVQEAQVTSKKEADVILKPYEENLGIRQFLLTNLVKSDTEPGKMRIRLPLDTLLASIDNIGDFPHAPDSGVTFDKPTLFVKGELSKYINRKNMPVAQALFPDSKVHVINGAGHWVHSEKPKEFVDLIEEFCR